MSAAIPAGWSLDFSIALTFMALLVCAGDRRSEWGGAGGGRGQLPALVLPHKVAAGCGGCGHRGQFRLRRFERCMKHGRSAAEYGGLRLGILLIRLQPPPSPSANTCRTTRASRRPCSMCRRPSRCADRAGILALNGSVSLAPDNPACGPRWPPSARRSPEPQRAGDYRR